MVSDLKEYQLPFFLLRLEQQPQAKSRTTLKQVRSQLSDPRPLVRVWKSPRW